MVFEIICMIKSCIGNQRVIYAFSYKEKDVITSFYNLCLREFQLAQIYHYCIKWRCQRHW